MMNIETITQQQIGLKEETVKEHQIVLYNDDVNTFDFVIDMLVKICNHDLLQAEQCAFIVHYKGKCSIKKGAYKDLEHILDILADSGLTVEIN